MSQNIILVAEDDEDDFILLQDAFKEVCRETVRFVWTRDGEQTLEFLNTPSGDNGRLKMVFLDLNMPKIDGREVLKKIRTSEHLNHLPVVVFTNSSSYEDTIKAYKLGVNSFIRKPAGYDELIDFVRTFHRYWFDFSKLA